ncbi:hypothetical protein B379_09605 [Anoxybacillus ayderensis G10]|nr:hypothetical protein B379_09605 [Anoxybacillus ayderensis G10]
MCEKCFGKGYSIQEVIPGAFSFTPCNCKYAEISKQQTSKEMIEFRKRLREAKEQLQMEMSG